MLTFQNLYELYEQHTGDDSSTNTTIGKGRVNDTHRELVGLHDWYFAEKTQNFTTAASDYKYDLPYDYGRMVAVTIAIASIHYELTEVASHDRWQRLHIYRETETQDFPEYFHITGDSLEIYPIPVSAGSTDNGTFYYTKRVVDMTTDDVTNVTESTTMTFTNGDETLTASGATFTAPMVGRWIKNATDQRWYEIASFTSTTAMELKKAYQGTTESGASYTIGEVPIIPEEYHALNWYQPVAQYWMMKKEPQQASYYQGLYDSGKQQLFNAYSKRTTAQLLEPIRRLRRGVPRTFDGSWIDPDYL